MARWFVDRLPQRGIPSVSLRRLLPEAQFVGCADWDVSGCTDDHRRLDPGQVFVAVRDARPGYDGHAFVREALERGAAGVVVERPCPEAGRLQVIVPDALSAHARLCQALAGDPSRHLVTLGVTGGSGRTIAALMMHSILEAAGERFGMIGSLGFRDGRTERAAGEGLPPASFSRRRASDDSSSAHAPLGANSREFAPDAGSLARLMSEMVERGCKGGVLEIPAVTINRGGVEGVTFRGVLVSDAIVPRGLPRDAMLEMRRAMARMVRQVVPCGIVVVNADDPDAEILGGVNLDSKRIAYSLLSGRPDSASADIRGRVDQIDSRGTRLVILGMDRLASVHLPLLGHHAASAALGAAAMAWALGINRQSIVEGLERIETIAGQTEAVNAGQDFEVRIDSARTAGALDDALSAVRALSTGRVICVMSAEAGTEQDECRRLSEVAERGADRVVLTVSNPRTEDPSRLVEQTLAGFRRPGKVRIEIDRQLAIETALGDARPGDVVLITGKGRERYQILADRVIPFNDAGIALQWLSEHTNSRHSVQRSA